MNALIRQASQTELCRSGIQELSRSLSISKFELKQTLELAADDYEAEALTNLILAAQVQNRKVSAEILMQAAPMLPDPEIFSIIAGHTSGDTIQVLIELVRSGKLDYFFDGVCLLLAAWLNNKEQNEATRLRQIASEARVLSRRPLDTMEQFVLKAAALEIKDDALDQLIGVESSDPIRRLRDSFISFADRPVLESLPQVPRLVETEPITRRRAVVKLGRNEACHCGSGKKYKKCCLSKDQERLRDSSQIAGVTRKELRENPEPYLNHDILVNMRPWELARLDPLRIDPSMHESYLGILNRYQLNESILRFFEMVGYKTDYDDYLFDSIYDATRNGEVELVRKLCAIRPKDIDGKHPLSFQTQFLLEGENPKRLLELLEQQALKSLQDEDQHLGAESIVSLVYSLLEGHWPALGILLGRGLVATGPLFDSLVSLDALLEARDRLDLTPEDPIEKLVNQRMHDEKSELEPDLSDRIEETLDIKQAEIERLRNELNELRQQEREESDVSLKRQPEVLEKTPSSTIDRSDGQQVVEVSKLREKIQLLKATIREKNREQRDAIAQLAAQKPTNRSNPTTESDEKDEEELLLKEEDQTVQGVRIPILPNSLHKRLQEIPKSIARTALELIGALAAGRRSAFQGSRNIKIDPTIRRQKVGRNHRLLFRLEPDRIEILDLIDRKKLERWLKNSLR